MQALTDMPRVSPSAWRASPVLVRWLISARASVLVMTFSAAALGGLLTISEPGWSLVAWLVCTTGLLLAHAGEEFEDKQYETGPGGQFHRNARYTFRGFPVFRRAASPSQIYFRLDFVVKC